ncbi:MAG: diguanylate cyclase [Nitrospirota bacterium]|nr:diguanylate cyclase [Nitrospirota bacterium]
MIKARIFIVEDEALIVMELMDRLERFGHEVCGTAASGDDALRQVAELLPDVILMDIRLAGNMDGIETARRIREQFDVPVVYLSAYTDDELIERAAATGPFGFLVKPFNEREVRATIDLAVYRGHAERRLLEVNRQLETSVEMLERQRKDILRLNKLSEDLQLCQSEDETYRVIGNAFSGLFPALAGFIAMRRDGGKILEVKQSWGGLSVAHEFQEAECPSLLSGEVCFTSGSGGTSCAHILDPAPESYLCVPLSAKGEPMGMIHLAQRMKASEMTPAAAEMAKAAAKTIELALANIRLRERLNEQAIHDPLTGLHNRRFLEDTLGHQAAQAVRAGDPVGVMMLDLDHFKRFNDTHGHAAGDLLLKEFGAFVRKHIRHGDYVCRYGGEEFVVVLPHSRTEATRKRAEELRRGLPAMICEHLGKRLGGVTVSIGIAQCPEDGQTAELLLRSADEALYRAKERGRDRIEIAGEDRKGSEAGQTEATNA